MKQVIAELKKSINHKSILIACSSGIDSTVLLNMIYQTKVYSKLVIVHINHQKRLASNKEEAYLIEYAKKHQLPIYTKRLSKNYQGNFQDWARKERYHFFLEVAKKEKVDIIVTAHHADDNLETILMRILKTSSLKGYAGIEKWTKLENYPLYRPLLNVDKETIVEYAKKHHLTYFQDASNFEDDYLRNRIRKYVIPFFKKENPSLIKAIATYSETILNANKIIEERINSFIKKEVNVNNNVTGQIQFSQSVFLELDMFIQIQILFTLLKKYKLTKSCIEEILKQIKAKKNSFVFDINPNLIMVKEYGNIIFTKPQEKTEFYLKISADGQYLLPYKSKLIVNKNICYFKAENYKMCYNIQELPVVVRTRQAGDRIHLKIGTKKISDYLTDKKVSHIERERILLLCNHQGEVLAILGYDVHRNK